MVQLKLHVEGMTRSQAASWIRSRLDEIPDDSVVKLKVHGKITNETLRVFSAPFLRSLAPATMNIDANLVEFRRYKTPSRKAPP
jgi:hypothetical protein